MVVKTIKNHIWGFESAQVWVDQVFHGYPLFSLSNQLWTTDIPNSTSTSIHSRGTYLVELKAEQDDVKQMLRLDDSGEYNMIPQYTTSLHTSIYIYT